MYCFYVVFFKQKTAYELRISDWSSDVCSSDLFDTICRSGLVVAGEQFLPLNYLTWRLSWMNLKLRRATASFFFPLPTAVVPLFAGARSPVPVPTDADRKSVVWGKSG